MRKKDECIAVLSSNDQGSFLLQFAATISVCFSQLGTGILFSWSSPSVQHLTSEKSEFPVTLKQAAWITSLSNIGFIFGFLIIPLFMDRIGRKCTLLLLAVPQIISWIMIAFAKSVIVLFLARIIGGVGYSCGGLISIYIAEIAEHKFRGMLSIFIIVSSELGMLLVSILSAYFSYHTMNLVLISIPLIFFFSFIFMPETPYFHLIEKQDEMSVKSLMQLRGVNNPKLIHCEIERMRKTVNEEHNLEKNCWNELFYNESNRRGLAIVICAHLTSVFSGSLVIIAYAQQIFQLKGFSVTPQHSCILLTVVKVISALIASQLIERLGRRFLYTISGIFTFFTLSFISLFFFLKLYFQIDTMFINLSLFISLIIYEIVSTLGLSCLPFVFGGEFFLIGVKKLAITITFIVASVTNFGAQLMFPLVNETLGIYTSFCIFAIVCLIGTLYNFFVMPETKGRSLEEIQCLLKLKINEDNAVRLGLISRKRRNYGTNKELENHFAIL